MASITIRNLDESAKQALRRRAAGNGRSMEEEARLLLAGLAELDVPPAAAAESVQPERVSTAPPAIAGFPAAGKRVLLILGGGIAAYKCLDLIRRLRERGVAVRPVMTAAAGEFITPLSVGALAADRVFTDLFDREDEQDVG
ncbi:MAG: bifunctional phosphopantothenoylcysteine decarboxylase/phosphopantothenate synthase, partial [Hyphomicrobiales bacterium]|nr:bifunctional phosphopantothenoylcysteine decarboxylase/phosphopantothenate synthase [Hyphomicrobiales bacterium]